MGVSQEIRGNLAKISSSVAPFPSMGEDSCGDSVKILLFGRGVITILYGWTFEKAGHNVTFYVRPGRSAEYGSHVHLDVLDARRGTQGKRSAESSAEGHRSFERNFGDNAPENLREFMRSLIGK